MSNELNPYTNNFAGVIEILSTGTLTNIGTLENDGGDLYIGYRLVWDVNPTDPRSIMTPTPDLNEGEAVFVNAAGAFYLTENYNAKLSISSAGVVNNYGDMTLDDQIYNFYPEYFPTWKTRNSGALTNYSGGTLLNRSELLNLNSGTLDNNGILDNQYRFRNEGTLNNGDTLTNNYQLINPGTLNNNSGGTLTLNASTSDFPFDNAGGTLENNGTIISGVDDLYFGGGGLINHNVGSTFINNVTMTNQAGSTLTNGSGVTLTNNNILNNEVTGTLNNSGTLYNNGTSGLASVPTNRGTLNNTGTLSNNDYGDLINDGLLYNKVGGLLNNPGGSITNNNTLINNGTINTTSGTFTNNGTYGGSGTIIGSWTDNGVTSPGNSAGVVTIEGDYYKRAGSKEIELGGHFHGDGDHSLTEFDWLYVTGDVELSGALNVHLIDSFELLAGMSFKMLHVGGTLTGQYDGLDEGALVGSFSGTNLYTTCFGGDGNDITLFTPDVVPEPATLLLALLGLSLLPRRR